jgi:hypothetical protein
VPAGAPLELLLDVLIELPNDYLSHAVMISR